MRRKRGCDSSVLVWRQGSCGGSSGYCGPRIVCVLTTYMFVQECSRYQTRQSLNTQDPPPVVPTLTGSCQIIYSLRQQASQGTTGGACVLWGSLCCVLMWRGEPHLCHHINWWPCVGHEGVMSRAEPCLVSHTLRFLNRSPQIGGSTHLLATFTFTLLLRSQRSPGHRGAGIPPSRDTPTTTLLLPPTTFLTPYIILLIQAQDYSRG